MKNLKISAKLIVSFLAISFISLIIGFCGIVSLLQMKASSQTLYEQETAPIPVISDVISDVKDMSDSGKGLHPLRERSFSEIHVTGKVRTVFKRI